MTDPTTTDPTTPNPTTTDPTTNAPPTTDPTTPDQTTDAPPAGGARIVGYVPDLMDRSKVAAAATVTFVNQPSALTGVEADLFVVDLARPGVMEVMPSLTGRVVGFARHTSRDLIAAARAGGCDDVVIRSEFFAHLDRFLALPAADG